MTTKGFSHKDENNAGEYIITVIIALVVTLTATLTYIHFWG